MIIYLDEAFHAYQRAGRMKTQHDLFEAITYGAVQRAAQVDDRLHDHVRPGAGAVGTWRRELSTIAAPMIGGLITSTILTLEIVPAIYSLVVYRRNGSKARVHRAGRVGVN